MATINISGLRPAGSQLFSDSEGYMSELGDSELDIINGGFTSSPICISTAISVARATIQRSSAACAKNTAKGIAYASGAVSGWITSPDF
jgi:hypothetical protein